MQTVGGSELAVARQRVPLRADQARSELQPCRACGMTDPRRMHALMALWFGRLVEPHVYGGYFYLCPSCYETRITPHEHPILDDIRAASSRFREA